MAKVFATLIQNDDVILKSWPSVTKFNETESFIDNKFIYIVTTDDFKEKWDSPAMFDYEIDSVIQKNTQASFSIVKTQNEIKAHNLMFGARNSYLKIGKTK